jgi:hypothetical protein
MRSCVLGLDRQGRIPIPRELQDDVVWWPGRKPTVMVELCETGLCRVYEVEALSGHFDRLREQVDALEPAVRAAEQGVLVDRYRELTLYADGRLQLTKEVALWLECYPFPSQSAQLLGESFATRIGISIFTCKYRDSRSARSGLALFEGHVGVAGSSR